MTIFIEISTSLRVLNTMMLTIIKKVNNTKTMLNNNNCRIPINEKLDTIT